MQIDERIKAFSNLGEKIHSIDNGILDDLVSKVGNENPWFTRPNIELSLTAIRKLLNNESLTRWTSSYQWPTSYSSKKVALISAGNIPLVGLHDILCILISGHRLQIKPSSKDTVLSTYLLSQLIEIEPQFEQFISITDKLKDFDAVIATGSDNSSRYFDYYFQNYPSIIRKNRTSCAILTGNESAKELEQLGTDVFSYFGLGCRNVSKLFVPKNYSLSTLSDHWLKFEKVIHHHKYANNYDYQKAIMMINKTSFLDNGFILLTQSDKIVSPIAVLYYDFYNSDKDLEEKITGASEKIQCVVGDAHLCNVPFGQAQMPELHDYADQVDILKFLIALAKA